MMRLLGFLGLAAAFLGLSAWFVIRALPGTPAAETAPASAVPAAVAEATPEQVHSLCGACHAYPPPESFPRSAWRKEVKQGYDFLRDSTLALPYPSLESVVRYYETRAPLELPLPRSENAPGEVPLRFNRQGFRSADGGTFPAVTNVNLVHLFDPKRLDVLSCDMRSGQVSVLRPYEANPTWRVLAKLPFPAHAEVVDLDGDGNLDVIVACLGCFYPSDSRAGSVVWLRGSADGTFTAIPLLEGVGRVADVQAADFNGDGKLDLVVAVFGWRKSGEILYLENRTKDWSKPVFVPHAVDKRHGAIHVPVCDLNGDGKPDFVALISQEHETIVAFLNEGDGRFRKETIYTAPHPAFGSSGIQLVDLNGDGRLDVLYTNGDSLDSHHLQPVSRRPLAGESRHVSLRPSLVDDDGRGAACGGRGPRRRRPAGRRGGELAAGQQLSGTRQVGARFGNSLAPNRTGSIRPLLVGKGFVRPSNLRRRRPDGRRPTASGYGQSLLQ